MNDGKITNREYRDLTGISDEGVRLDYNMMIEKDPIESHESEREEYCILRMGD